MNKLSDPTASSKIANNNNGILLFGLIKEESNQKESKNKIAHAIPRINCPQVKNKVLLTLGGTIDVLLSFFSSFRSIKCSISLLL